MSSFLTSLRTREKSPEEEIGGQMSFLEHLDELRSRIIRSIVFVFVAFVICWFFSDHIYNFLARPVQVALAEAQRRDLGLTGITGHEAISSLSTAKEGETGRYVFSETTKIGPGVIPMGASVQARVMKDSQGQTGLYTAEP